jgi:Phospholipase_D-nuclease N-terminal
MPPDIIQQITEMFARYILVIVIVVVVWLLVWLITIIDIVRSEFKRDADKVVWFLFVTANAPLGAFLYFLIGRFQKTDAERVSRYTRYRDIGRE